MQSTFTMRRKEQSGFSLLEMLFATLILLIGLIAVAQLVPASILINNRNRTDSASLVFAQRELDQFLGQQLTATSFTDSLGNSCNLGDTTHPGTLVGNPVVIINGQTMIDFSATPQTNYSFTYNDFYHTKDSLDTDYDVRWAVVTIMNGPNITGKRIILGVRQQGGNGFALPITLDTMVER